MSSGNKFSQEAEASSVETLVKVEGTGNPNGKRMKVFLKIFSCHHITDVDLVQCTHCGEHEIVPKTVSQEKQRILESHGFNDGSEKYQMKIVRTDDPEILMEDDNVTVAYVKDLATADSYVEIVYKSQ